MPNASRSLDKAFFPFSPALGTHGAQKRAKAHRPVLLQDHPRVSFMVSGFPAHHLVAQAFQPVGRGARRPAHNLACPACNAGSWWHRLSSLCFGRRAASPLQDWGIVHRWVAAGGHGGPPLQSLATRGRCVVGASPRACPFGPRRWSCGKWGRSVPVFPRPAQSPALLLRPANPTNEEQHRRVIGSLTRTWPCVFIQRSAAGGRMEASRP